MRPCKASSLPPPQVPMRESLMALGWQKKWSQPDPTPLQACGRDKEFHGLRVDGQKSKHLMIRLHVLCSMHSVPRAWLPALGSMRSSPRPQRNVLNLPSAQCHNAIGSTYMAPCTRLHILGPTFSARFARLQVVGSMYSASRFQLHVLSFTYWASCTRLHVFGSVLRSC